MRSLSLAAVAWLLLFALVQAKETPRAENVGLAMTDAAQKMLAALTPEQRAKAVMSFDDPRRLDWHNIPKPERKGLQFRDMTAAQQKLSLDMLRAALSESGYAKARKIMSLESNLHEGEKNLKDAPLRHSERYFLTIFGQPDATGTWGWSFEGHHLSLNFVVRDGQVVSDTPSFWGANPATVHVFVEGGPEKGTRTLAQEEQLAVDLVNSLDDAQRKQAIIAEKAPEEYRAAGKPQPPHTAPEGLAAEKMTPDQQRLLWSLLEAYNSNLAPELTAARLAEIKTHGLDRVYFAWAGATQPGVGHYYRVQGPTFVLELINVQADPAGNVANHVHSVWRSLNGDFGVAGQ